ncbi:hypothetical protein F5887DRAFT_1008425, partial [Amanita rubescens]
MLGESSSPVHFIPFGPDTDRFVVGHNITFDRARVESEYSSAGTRTRRMDTMSLHIAVNGISSHQRPAWNEWKKKKRCRGSKRLRLCSISSPRQRRKESRRGL